MRDGNWGIVPVLMLVGMLSGILLIFLIGVFVIYGVFEGVVSLVFCFLVVYLVAKS